MALQPGTRSTWNDVIRPEDILSEKLSSQGDNSGVVDQAAIGGTITGATNATPIVITETGHSRLDGDLLFISAVAGNTAANGLRIIANAGVNDYELTDLLGVDVAGNGAYTSGGLSYIALWYKVPATQLALIRSFSLHAVDASYDGDGYMGLTALTNGMRLDIYRGTTLLKALNPAPVGDFADWADMAGAAVTNLLGLTAASDVQAFVEGNLGHGLLKLDGSQDDSIILIQNDSLAGLDHQEIAISGFLEDLPT